MRPRSIVLFDWLYLGSLVGSLLTVPISYAKLDEARNSDPGVAALGGSLGAVLVVTLLVVVALSLLLWFYVSQRASNVAKWILVVFTAIGVAGMVPSLMQPRTGGVQLAFAVALTLMQVVAAAFLFREDARDWFAGRRWVDPDVFN